MRRGAFDYAAEELNLPRHLRDKVWKAVKHHDQVKRLIWEVNGKNQKSLIVVCAKYGSASEERYTVRHKTLRVKIPLSWRIPMSEEHPTKDKLMTMRLVDGEKPLGMEEAIAEYLKEWYTNPYKRAEATATLLVARRTDTGDEAMHELFWAGIWYAKKHPEKVVITEQDMPTQRDNTISYVS